MSTVWNVIIFIILKWFLSRKILMRQILLKEVKLLTSKYSLHTYLQNFHAYSNSTWLHIYLLRLVVIDSCEHHFILSVINKFQTIITYLEGFLEASDDHGEDHVESFTNGVEQHQTEGNANHGIEDGEDLAWYCVRGGMSITCREIKINNIWGIVEFS